MEFVIEETTIYFKITFNQTINSNNSKQIKCDSFY